MYKGVLDIAGTYVPTRKISETNFMSSMLKQRKIHSMVNFLVL